MQGAFFMQKGLVYSLETGCTIGIWRMALFYQNSVKKNRE